MGIRWKDSETRDRFTCDNIGLMGNGRAEYICPREFIIKVWHDFAGLPTLFLYVFGEVDRNRSRTFLEWRIVFWYATIDAIICVSCTFKRLYYSNKFRILVISYAYKYKNNFSIIFFKIKHLFRYNVLNTTRLNMNVVPTIKTGIISGSAWRK